MHTELGEERLGVREYIHQMRDRRPLIAPDIGNPGLQQGFGHRENPLTAEYFALA